jgi:hypothetical protein
VGVALLALSDLDRHRRARQDRSDRRTGARGALDDEAAAERLDAPLRGRQPDVAASQRRRPLGGIEPGSVVADLERDAVALGGEMRRGSGRQAVDLGEYASGRQAG